MMRTYFYFAILIVLLPGCADRNTSPAIIKVDLGNEIGEIRALNGGNLGPVCDLRMLDLTAQFEELNIPLIRTHDVPWFSGEAVDVHTIFRNFRLDPANPDNYDFRKTDAYIASLLATGANVVFRLGESIEHTDTKYFVHPPKDFDKWAEVCCGIIRHYNEGWADGFKYNIQYWEIWNEPDIRPSCWTGTDEQFIDLYQTTATRIKGEFPDIKVGGPAVAHPANMDDGKAVATPFTGKFLAHCSQHAIPLDFFSWHFYSDNPWDCIVRSTAVRKLLDQHGFEKAESHMNEWNYIPDNNWNHLMKDQGAVRRQAYEAQSGVKGAAYLANVLMLLQDLPVDVANFYATTAGLFGIFSEYGEPRKAYYAHKAFAELLQTPIRISTTYDPQDSLVVCSGTNEARDVITVLISNFTNTSKETQIDIRGSLGKDVNRYEFFMIDDTKDLSELEVQTTPEQNIAITLVGPSVMLVRISAYE